MHEVLVNRLGGLSLPRKSVVRLTDRPDLTLDVYRGRKTTMQQQQQQPLKYMLRPDPSSEPYCRDASRDGSQHMFLLRNKKSYPQYPILSGALHNPIKYRNKAANHDQQKDYMIFDFLL